jgi:hypothetical protein
MNSWHDRRILDLFGIDLPDLAAGAQLPSVARLDPAVDRLQCAMVRGGNPTDDPIVDHRQKLPANCGAAARMTSIAFHADSAPHGQCVEGRFDCREAVSRGNRKIPQLYWFEGRLLS